MDYFAEIAGATDVQEAFYRLHAANQEGFPTHMCDERYSLLLTEYPLAWRAELSNWLYQSTHFAASLWSELKYCRANRDRVARAAYRKIREHQYFAELASDPEFARSVTKAARESRIRWPARYAWVPALLVEQGLDLDRDAVELTCQISDLMTPTGVRVPSMPQDRAHALLDELSEAAEIAYTPPAFISRLMQELASSSDFEGSDSDRTSARDSLSKLQKRVKVARDTGSQDEIEQIARELIGDRDLVVKIARAYGTPVPFAIVHEEELQQIDETRNDAGRAELKRPGAEKAAPTVREASPMRRAMRADLVGLTFSGGGIRSATFNLGVLQGLAGLDVLKHCDYLSTVSGGGYIGSWFGAWMQRLGEQTSGTGTGIAKGASEVLEDLRLRLTPERSPNPLDARVFPIRHLREFSNYLTPKTGFFSADSWTMIAIYLRNTMLNLMVLVPLMAAVLLIPRGVTWIITLLERNSRNSLWIPCLMAVLGIVATSMLIANLRRAAPPHRVAERFRRGRSAQRGSAPSVPFFSKQGWIQALIVLPMLAIACLTASSYWLWLHGPVELANGLTLVHWRTVWSGLPFEILPHFPLLAACWAAVAMVLLVVGIVAVAGLTAHRWLARPEIRYTLALSFVAGPLVASIFIWAITRLAEIFLTADYPVQGLRNHPITAVWTSLIIVTITYRVVVVFLPKTRRKIKSIYPIWVTWGATLIAAAVTVLGSLWGTNVVLLTLAPDESGLGFIARHWPTEPVRSAAVATAWIFFLFLFIFGCTRGFVGRWPRWYRSVLSLLLAVTGASAAAFGLFWVIGKIMLSWGQPEGIWYAVAFGTPLVLAAFSLVIVVQLGLLGAYFPDEQREWWSRLRAWTLIYSVAWTALFLLAWFPPRWNQELAKLSDGWGGYGGIVLWLLSTYAGVKTGIQANGGGAGAGEQNKKEMPKDVPARGSLKIPALQIVAQAAPYVFILGLLVLISISLQAIIEHNTQERHGTYWERLTRTSTERVLFWFVILAGTSVFVSVRIGVNEFSMHHFYKNRLVRCYLGASNWEGRKPDWFTGFDSADDMPLRAFDRSSATGTGPGAWPYAGPYPIVNAALNLVAGEDLAWQERKATSFAFTPKYCGYDIDRAVFEKESSGDWPDAYVPTRHYEREGRGPMLGKAMAISGAAASPNMGKVTSPASAFLMTVFNVRLGWWLPNTRRRKVNRHSGPPFGVTYTGIELFGLTDDKRKYVNVSDGGHFENLGVYELIRRGCRYIIVCDAGQDSSFGMEDLGNLVRKCRTDFGVEIDIGVDRIRQRDARQWSQAHCVVGKIHYLGVPQHDADGFVKFENGRPLHEEGLLVYLKPSITGDEPFDVLEYYKRVPEFPHESTADQWFTESQFESYRRLGIHIADTTFRRQRELQNGFSNPGELFEQLRRFWYPPSTKISEYSTEHTLEYSRIMDVIRSKESMAFLDSVLFEKIESGLGVYSRDEFYVCNALIQLIQNVYTDLDLEQNYQHPQVEGWMAVFQRWARQPAFRRTWPLAENTYTERFRKFYQDRLENGAK